MFFSAFALVGGSVAQFRSGRNQRLRSGRQETGYAAPPPDAQPAYGGDQDVYQVRIKTNNF